MHIQPAVASSTCLTSLDTASPGTVATSKGLANRIETWTAEIKKLVALGKSSTSYGLTMFNMGFYMLRHASTQSQFESAEPNKNSLRLSESRLACRLACIPWGLFGLLFGLRFGLHHSACYGTRAKNSSSHLKFNMQTWVAAIYLCWLMIASGMRQNPKLIGDGDLIQ